MPTPISQLKREAIAERESILERMALEEAERAEPYPIHTKGKALATAIMLALNAQEIVK